MEHKYMVLSLDATDEESYDGDKNVLFVERLFFFKKKAKELYNELKKKYSNVYLVEIIKKSEYI